MKLEVVSIDGLDRAAEGWRFSRNIETPIDPLEISKVDVPVNELPSVVLAFEKFMIIEREIFAAPRNHVMWARTSHVDDPLEFTIPNCFIDGETLHFTEACRARMAVGKAAGQSQDEWRSFLPAISETSWTSRISFRDLVKLALYFERLEDSVAPELSERIHLVGSQLMKVLDFFTKDRVRTCEVLDSMQQPANFLCEDELFGWLPGRSDSLGFHQIRLEVPLWLRAQIVRHRNLGFVDDFFSKVLRSSKFREITISQPIKMELSVEKEFWKTILAKRGCWLAQDTLSKGRDLWQVIIDEFGATEPVLPCDCGVCPYRKDASLRLTDEDPGAPCPIFLQLENIDQTPYVAEMEKAAKSRAPFWMSKIRRVA